MAYVYRHVRKDTNQPFYVGIGKSSDQGKYIRSTSGRNRNKYWRNITTKTDYSVEVMLDDLTWIEACEKEREFILLYGRKDSQTGTLVNMTDGGDGRANSIVSEETKRKIGDSNRGQTRSEEAIAKMRVASTGFTHSEETKAKMRKPKSEKHKANLSISHKGQVAWNKDKILSGEHKKNLSLSMTGKPWSEARRVAQNNRKNKNKKLL